MLLLWMSDYRAGTRVLYPVHTAKEKMLQKGNDPLQLHWHLACITLPYNHKVVHKD